MRINGISTNYLYANKKMQSFRAKNEEEKITKEEVVDSPLSRFVKDYSNSKASLAAFAGLILGIFLIHDAIAIRRYSQNEEKQNITLTNDTFNVSEEMEDTYQTVLSNKLQKARYNLSSDAYKRVKYTIDILEKSSKK